MLVVIVLLSCCSHSFGYQRVDYEQSSSICPQLVWYESVKIMNDEFSWQLVSSTVEVTHWKNATHAVIRSLFCILHECIWRQTFCCTGKTFKPCQIRGASQGLLPVSKLNPSVIASQTSEHPNVCQATCSIKGWDGAADLAPTQKWCFYQLSGYVKNIWKSHFKKIQRTRTFSAHSSLFV